MPTSATFRKDLATLAIAAVAMFFAPPGPSDAKAQESLAGDKLSAVLTNTRLKGVPTLAVFSSRDEPESGKLAAELVEGAWARANRGLFQVLNISKENDPAFVKSSGITRFPTVVVYGRGPKGVALLGSITGCETAEALATRLTPYNLGLVAAPAAAPNDTEVSPANFPNPDVHASTQFPSPSPATPSTATPSSNPAPAPAAPAPSMGVVATPAGLIQVPSQNLVIQQAPSQIFVAPAQAPMVYIAQMAVPSSAPSSANMFLPAASPPQPVATPASAPTSVLAATAATPTTGAQLALSNQMLSMPTMGSSTRVRVRGPGLLASILARVGERMTRLGRARIETVQSTDLQSPFAQSSAAGLTTINTMSATPIQQPQVSVVPSSIPSPPQPPVCPAPPPAMPTPQNPPQKHSWFGHN